jgi:hypothetical protein
MTDMDKFPEAFRRFENDVDISKFESYHQFITAFRWWGGQRWKGTAKQWRALNREAENLGFNVPNVYRDSMRGKRYSEVYYVEERASTWRMETVNVKGAKQARYRDLRTGRFIKKP